jgi:hypothetical protein
MSEIRRRMTVMFGLDYDQSVKLDAWLDQHTTALAAAQLRDPELAPHVTVRDGKAQPYLGAIGGGLTYAFTPTGLGVVVRATFCQGTPLEATIDLTDYGSW